MFHPQHGSLPLNKSQVKRVSENKYKSKYTSNLPIIKNNDTDIDFFGKYIVITGVFKKYERSEIADAVETLGAVVRGTISRKTDIVICGEDYGPSKLAKVVQLREDGIKDILVIDEDYLDDIL